MMPAGAPEGRGRQERRRYKKETNSTHARTDRLASGEGREGGREGDGGRMGQNSEERKKAGKHSVGGRRGREEGRKGGREEGN